MKAGTCIAFFVIIFTCFQFSLWARYGNAWTAGNRFARRGYTTLSQKKMNTTEHASGVLQNGSEFRFVSLPSHESRLVEKEIRVSSLRPSTADKHDSEVINVRRKKHARHMNKAGKGREGRERAYTHTTTTNTHTRSSNLNEDLLEGFA